MHKPFTYAQATDIAEDFSDLEDTGLIIDMGLESTSCHIHKVVVTPYSKTDKELFFNLYKANTEPLQALAHYNGNEYEVVILAVDNADNSSLITMTIREYTDKYGVRYNYP